MGSFDAFELNHFIFSDYLLVKDLLIIEFKQNKISQSESAKLTESMFFDIYR